MNGNSKSTNLLCIFSRYPSAGECKTRLIPALGAEGAADLQEKMTRHIIRMGQQADCDVLLCMDGGTATEVSLWLGDIPHVCQEGDDLGARMDHAFAVGFARGYENILLVGSDCPAITASFFAEGFLALASADLVFGPSVDGGYYLIGMTKRYPELFTGIEWGTSQVLKLSLQRASKLDVRLLPALHDIDEPDDLNKLPEFMQYEISVVS